MRSLIVTALLVLGSLVLIQTTAAVLESSATRTVHYDTVGDTAEVRR